MRYTRCESQARWHYRKIDQMDSSLFGCGSHSKEWIASVGEDRQCVIASIKDGSMVKALCLSTTCLLSFSIDVWLVYAPRPLALVIFTSALGSRKSQLLRCRPIINFESEYIARCSSYLSVVSIDCSIAKEVGRAERYHAHDMQAHMHTYAKYSHTRSCITSIDLFL